MTFVGHATLVVEAGGALLVTDPVLRARVGFLRWTAPAPSLDLLRQADAVLVSHLHHDHCDVPSLRLLGRDRPLFVPYDTADFFRRRGFCRVVPLHPGTKHRVAGISVTATHAEHSGRREPFGTSGTAVGYLLAADGQCAYFAGDTGLFPQMRGLAPVLDLALLPVAGWGTTVGPGHLDASSAAEATRLLRPCFAVPIHWGALRPLWERSAHGLPRQSAAAEFASEVKRLGSATAVQIIEPGAAWELPG